MTTIRKNPAGLCPCCKNVVRTMGFALSDPLRDQIDGAVTNMETARDELNEAVTQYNDRVSEAWHDLNEAETTYNEAVEEANRVIDVVQMAVCDAIPAAVRSVPSVHAWLRGLLRERFELRDETDEPPSADAEYAQDTPDLDTALEFTDADVTFTEEDAAPDSVRVTAPTPIITNSPGGGRVGDVPGRIECVNALTAVCDGK